MIKTNLNIPIINNEDILAIYPFGSRVYGTENENSDFDYIVVVSNIYPEKQEYNDYNTNYSIYNEECFKSLVKENEITAMECLSLPKEKVYESRTIEMEINLHNLRESLSRKSSNSWVKAKKKLTVSSDYNLYIAQKSLFHSIRILIFGIQIAKFGKVINFNEANKFWGLITSIENPSWESYKEILQPIYNQLKSEFKRVAPKERSL